MAEKTLYKVIFVNQGQVYEIFARHVSQQSGMPGFIELEELTFGERTQVVVDPSEEKLKDEFAGVRRTYIPIYSLIRIDEVEKQGSSRITDAKGNITPFPMSQFTPGDKS